MNKELVFMSGITHDTKPQQDKIRYFVDCLNLYSISYSFPLSPLNLNLRLFSNGLLTLMKSDSYSKYLYVEHYYSYYKDILLTESHILYSFCNRELKALNIAFVSFMGKKPWDKSNKSAYDPTDLTGCLEDLSRLLDVSFVENTVNLLKKAVFCKEGLDKHNHVEVIEECAKALIAEFRSIGYGRDKIDSLFSDANGFFYRDFDDLGPYLVYSIPVPDSIYNHRKTDSFEEYRKKVKLYVTSAKLENQFDNIVYLYNQAQRERKYVFKINNLRFETKESFDYNGVVFSGSLLEKYTNSDSNEEYIRFFRPSDVTTFCEVSILSGSDTASLQKAVNKVQEALNYIHYYVADNIKKTLKRSHINLKTYVALDLSPRLITRNEVIRVIQNDLEDFKYLKDLEALSNNKAVANYLKTDRIFFSASTEIYDYKSISQLWQYCEALFEDGPKGEDIIKRISHYLSKKSPHHIYTGLRYKIGQYNVDLHHSSDEKLKLLGLDHSTLTDKMNQKYDDVKEYIRDFNKIIRHPLINRKKEHVFQLRSGQIEKEVYNHCYKVFKSAYIHRNLYQHSNIEIDELKNVWFDAVGTYCSALRRLIIADLKIRPNISKIEDLFNT